MRIGSIQVDLAARRVFRDGTEVELTAREFSVFEILAKRRGHVVPRATILDHIYDDESELMSNANRDSAILEVVDTGVGISSEDLPRVFEPFYRADPARSRDAGGAGLGLAVARAIVRRHGGDITCLSRLKTGTTVTLSLPTAVTS